MEPNYTFANSKRDGVLFYLPGQHRDVEQLLSAIGNLARRLALKAEPVPRDEELALHYKRGAVRRRKDYINDSYNYLLAHAKRAGAGADPPVPEDEIIKDDDGVVDKITWLINKLQELGEEAERKFELASL